MGHRFGSRTLVVICGALVILLGALAVVQYRWSSRVAAADAQREREHLDAAASLFADQFNGIAHGTVDFLQTQAMAALRTGTPAGPLPNLVAELFYVNIPEGGEAQAKRLNAQGTFEPVAIPEWLRQTPCGEIVTKQPLALVLPVREIAEAGGDVTIRLEKVVANHRHQCLVARLDESYLGRVIPQLIRQSFGATSAGEYDFAVKMDGSPIYGTAARADLRRPFFSVSPEDMRFGKALVDHTERAGGQAIIVQRVFVSRTASHTASWLGPGAWELDVARKGMPLAAAFEQTRRRNLMVSVGMEALLLAAIAFLVIAAQRMERLADQKMRFVAGVSHELRTPVSAIAMLSRNQADGLVTGAERVKQYGELMHQQSRRLNDMVEQTLQYAGIGSGRMQPAKQAVDLRRLIEETVESRKAELASRGFKIEMALDADLPALMGDPQWLRTAVDNLLSNAEKHAGEGHWIRVSASHSMANKEVRISVEDHGGGIDPADQEEIFEPFSRGHAAVDQQIPGSGMGLSLVRSAVEAHHGSVTLVSEPGRGSTFTLHLPV